LFCILGLSAFLPKKDNVLFSDVEIAGSGELEDAISNSNRKEKFNEEKKEEITKEEEKPIPEEKQMEKEEDEKNKVSSDDRDFVQKKEEIKENSPKDSVEKEIPEEESSTEKKENDIEEKPSNPEEKNSEDDILDDKMENIKSEKDTPVREKPKPRKNKKALMNIINEIDKNDKKKKLQEEVITRAKEEIRRKKRNEFNEILNKSVNDVSKNADIGENSQKAGVINSDGGAYGLNSKDYEMISSQIYPHWAVPSGVKDVENIIVEIHLEIRDNGTVIPDSIKILDVSRYSSDYSFRAAADSARRAILEASPLKIPRDKIELFRKFTLRFNLKEALGG
jgi:hypothetical protein